jgi:hypothetical protein
MLYYRVIKEMLSMNNTKNYRYVIELDSPMWPRKLADELSYAPGIFQRLVGITDLQNAGHIYGATYPVRDSGRRRPQPGRLA